LAVKQHVYEIAIVDDQPIRRGGMQRLVQDDPDLRIAASVGDVEELTLLNSRHDVVVVDLQVRADGAALGVISRLAQISRPMVISTWDGAPSLLAAVRAGAGACVSRQSDPSTVVSALKVVARGGLYICGHLHHQFRAELAGGPRGEPNGLAPREVETLRWIASGFTQAQIATRMGLTEATINTYAKRIRAKLKVTNKAELTRRAIQLGHLVDDHSAHHAA
jgi:DNA-binding NarL/FixJ family response regulator